MASKVLDSETLEKYFVNREDRTYGKISQREQRDKLLNMDKELAEALNSEECLEVQSNEFLCQGRLNSVEVDHYLSDMNQENWAASYNDVRLLNLLTLQDLELKIGTPLFTDSAKALVEKHFSRRVENLYGSPDLQKIRREIGISPHNQQKTYVAKFYYQGKAIELINGGFRYDTQIWDPLKGDNGEYEDITVTFYHSDLFVMGDGSQLIQEPTVLPRFIPAVEQALLSGEAIEKIYAHPRGYQLETEGQSTDPGASPKDLPVMVLYWDPTTVFIEARRMTYDGDPIPVTEYNDGKPSRVRHVKLIVKLDQMDQEDFISEEADLSRLKKSK